MANGMIERSDGNYDHVSWIDDLTLNVGDRLSIQHLPGDGTTPVAKFQTHEELEALRLEVCRAEAAGEYDEARATPRIPIRNSCGLALQTPDGVSRETRAIGVVMTALCDGIWGEHHRPAEWRLRLWGMPTEPTAPGFWQPMEGGLHVFIQA